MLGPKSTECIQESLDIPLQVARVRFLFHVKRYFVRRSLVHTENSTHWIVRGLAIVPETCEIRKLLIAEWSENLKSSEYIRPSNFDVLR